jgi:hypothetical protein
MDYKKLYYKFCDYCINTDLLTRMIKRNKNDERIGCDYIYTEKHHIIPRHSGGKDVEYNIVEMLPEEHYMAHLIRYMAYNDKNDFLSIRFMLNGFNNKLYLKEIIPIKTKNKLVKSFKCHMSDFRKKHNWHTDEGAKNISKARQGTFPAIDKKTGKKIGSVSVNHPNVLNGKWVHHTYGTVNVIINETGKKTRVNVDDYHNNKHLYTLNTGEHKGYKNNRYSGITDDEIVDMVIELSKKVGLGYIIPYPTCVEFYKNFYGLNLPKSLSKFRFNGEKIKGLVNKIKEKTDLKYDVYLFNKRELRKKINKKLKKIGNVKN